MRPSFPDPSTVWRLGRLEGERRRLLDQLGALTPEQQARPFTEGTWSLLEVAQHLLRVEEGLLGSGRLGRGPARASGPTRLRFALVTLLLRSRLRLRTTPAAQPGERLSLRDVEERWEAARAELRRHAGSADGQHMTFLHPLIGPLSLDRLVRFLDDHARHHRPQVERLLAAVSPHSSGPPG